MSVFITGTDTGVGKTVLTSAVLSILRRAGVDAVPMKPVQTGCTERAGVRRIPDLDFLLQVSGCPVDEEERAWMAPYAYEPACSPHLAARLAGDTVSLDQVVEAFRALERRHDFVAVEGAGGLMVPLNEGELMLDLIRRLELPVLVAARTGWGTLNHTLLTLFALRAAGIEPAGVVFSGLHPGPLSYLEKDNLDAVRTYGRTAVAGPLPYLPELETAVEGIMDPDRFFRAVEPLAPALKAMLKLDIH
jgi:dethiobiotin synthase